MYFFRNLYEKVKNRLYRFCSQLPQGEGTKVAQNGLDNGANVRHNALRKTKGSMWQFVGGLPMIMKLGNASPTTALDESQI